MITTARTDAAIGLLLLGSLKSTQRTDIEDELIENANLLHVDTPKQRDVRNVKRKTREFP